VLRDEEIGQAYQFGNESTVRNVLEPNWWEADVAQEEARVVADEVLRLDQERRMREEEEGEEEKMQGDGDGDQEVDEKPQKGKNGMYGGAKEEKSRVVARSRVS